MDPLEIMEFYEGNQTVEVEGNHPTIRMNAEDFATVLAELRRLSSTPGAATKKQIVMDCINRCDGIVTMDSDQRRNCQAEIAKAVDRAGGEEAAIVPDLMGGHIEFNGQKWVTMAEWQDMRQEALSAKEAGIGALQAWGDRGAVIAELKAENAKLRARLLTAAGDDLCRLTQEEIKAYTSGAVQIPPEEEFIPSCLRFHQQIAGTEGVLQNCLTSAQMAAEITSLEAENARLRAGGWLPIESAPKDGTDILAVREEDGKRGRARFVVDTDDTEDGGAWWFEDVWSAEQRLICWQPLPSPPGSPDAKGTASGFAMIMAERQRQISEEGWTPEHDAQHGDGQLAAAAACYALPRGLRTPWVNEDELTMLQAIWPFDWKWWKPAEDRGTASRIRELVKAGALIAAEIDRLSPDAKGTT